MKSNYMQKLALKIVLASLALTFIAPLAHAAVDTDADGYADYIEIENKYDPYSPCGKNVYSGAVYAYGTPRLVNLGDESCRANYLRDQITRILGSQQLIEDKNWNTLVRAFVYGHYSPQEISTVIKTGQPLVHPTFGKNTWSRSTQYLKALEDKNVQAIMNVVTSRNTTTQGNYVPYPVINQNPQSSYNAGANTYTQPSNAIGKIKVVDAKKNPLPNVFVTLGDGSDDEDINLDYQSFLVTDSHGIAYITGSLDVTSISISVKLTADGLTTKTTKTTLRKKVSSASEITVDYKRPAEISSKFATTFTRNLIVTTPAYSSVYNTGNISEVEIITTNKADDSTLNGYTVVLANQSYKDDKKLITATNIAPGFYVARLTKKDPATQKVILDNYFTVIVKKGERTHINLLVDSTKKVISYN